MRASTEGKARIYLTAAQEIERNEGGLACCAIARAEGCTLMRDSAHIEPFADVFKPEGPEGLAWWPVGDGTDARILALCFMAAMVEAGDA